MSHGEVQVGGLELDEEHPGWKAFRVRPRPGGGLTSARVTPDTIRGRITSAWKLEEGTFTLTIEVPVNTTATVFLPYDTDVRKDGAPAGAPGPGGGRAIGAGTHTFTASSR